MSKDFIVIDVRKPEYKIVRDAFEVYLREGYPHSYTERTEDLRYTLYKLGFGDLVEEYFSKKECAAEIPYEDPIVPIPPFPIE